MTDQWKNEILESLQGMRRAEPAPFVYQKIRAQIATKATFQVVKRPYVALAAAAFALLITANVALFSRENRVPPSPSVYRLESADFNLY